MSAMQGQACPACTFQNSAGQVRCEMCATALSVIPPRVEAPRLEAPRSAARPPRPPPVSMPTVPTNNRKAAAIAASSPTAAEAEEPPPPASSPTAAAEKKKKSIGAFFGFKKKAKSTEEEAVPLPPRTPKTPRLSMTPKTTPKTPRMSMTSSPKEQATPPVLATPRLWRSSPNTAGIVNGLTSVRAGDINLNYYSGADSQYSVSSSGRLSSVEKRGARVMISPGEKKAARLKAMIVLAKESRLTATELLERHSASGYDTLDVEVQKAKIALSLNLESEAQQKQETDCEHAKYVHYARMESMLKAHLGAMRNAGAAFDHGFEEDSLGFSIVIARYGNKGREFVEVEETMEWCALYPGPLKPTDELIALNDEVIVEPNFDDLREAIQFAKRPLKLTFISGERRKEAFAEQEERRAMISEDKEGDRSMLFEKGIASRLRGLAAESAAARTAAESASRESIKAHSGNRERAWALSRTSSAAANQASSHAARAQRLAEGGIHRRDADAAQVAAKKARDYSLLQERRGASLANLMLTLGQRVTPWAELSAWAEGVADLDTTSQLALQTLDERDPQQTEFLRHATADQLEFFRIAAGGGVSTPAASFKSAQLTKEMISEIQVEFLPPPQSATDAFSVTT